MLRASPSHRVGPRRQLCAQVRTAVHEGRLAPGQRLPSTRRLARRLGIHRNTVAAAYRELSRDGLVVLRRGAPARVRGSAWARGLRVRGRRRGLAVVASDRGVRSIARHELKRAFPGTRVLALGPGDAAGLAAAAGESLLVAELSAISLLYGRRPRPAAVPLRRRRPSSLRQAVTRARPLGIVGLFTVSRCLREEAVAWAAAARGEEVTLLAPAPDDERGVESALRLADVLFADPLYPWPGGAAPVGARILPLVARETLRSVAERGFRPRSRPSEPFTEAGTDEP